MNIGVVTGIVFEGLKVDETQTGPKLDEEALSVYVLGKGDIIILIQASKEGRREDKKTLGSERT